MKCAKEPVRLRQKKLVNGNISLYLDVYRNGRREYEFLKMYLIPELSKEDKETNKHTLQLATAIKAKRIVSLQNGEYGFKDAKVPDTLFYAYFRTMCESKLKKGGSKSTWETWNACLHHLLAYDSNEGLMFKDITKKWVQGFCDYLSSDTTVRFALPRMREKQSLSVNTQSMYLTKLNACFNQACKEGIISKNPLQAIEKIKGEESTRMYLTVGEIKRLVHAECSNPEIKRAFLFSCLTGLRSSDVKKLTWGEVSRQGGFTRIIFKQKKTKEREYLDITQQAADLMGDRGEQNDFVFKMPTRPYLNRVLRVWTKEAGIEKEITFHCARHTFATMMLDIGTDLYTVSKLLGHRNLATTQIYAKIVDKKKQKAVANIPNVLDV